MRVTKVLCLALVLLFAICVSGFSADTEAGLRTKIAELQNKQAHLEAVWMQTILIEVEMTITQNEIARLGHRLHALKRGVSA